VVVDSLLARSANYIGGANEVDFHLGNVCCGRDFEPDFVHDIATVFEGAGCIDCGHALNIERGVEVGNIFQLGTRYTSALGASYTDENGGTHPIVMGSYGIGLGRLMACVAEEHHDEFGLQWPIAIAPYQVNLVSIGKSDTLKSTALSTYELLQRRGLEVLFDDRDASPGVKFADADLRGIPLRVTVSERGMAAGTVELKNRLTGETMHVPHDEIGGLLGGLVGRS